jgi:predicted dehydrogenase
MKDNTKKALIIGCGNMGCFYDSPGSSDVFSHAHALSLQNYSLYFYDKNKESSAKAAALWSGVLTDNINSIKYDVVVVATSTSTHYEILRNLDPKNFEALVIEKPFCEKSSQAAESLNKFKNNLVFVNYSRLYFKFYQNLKKRILKNELGKCIGFNGVYSKGLLNNGSHLLSLLSYLTDFKFSQFTINNKYQEKTSGYTNYDLFFIEDKGERGTIMGLDDSLYSIWETVIYFEKGIISLSNFGQEVKIQMINNSAPELTKLNYNDAIIHLYEMVVSKDEEFAKLSQNNSVIVHKILENVLGA